MEKLLLENYLRRITLGNRLLNDFGVSISFFG